MQRLTLLETARAYVKAGLSLIPVYPAGHASAKSPSLSSWKDYQTRHPSDAELKQWFATGKQGIGLISGAISGNLETLDFDETGLVEPFIQSVQGYDLDLFEKVKAMPLVQTPSGGAHLRYRCADPIEGNKKLAMSAAKKVRIETRGEAGYAVAPPSPGYILLQGDLTNLPALSPDDRDLLHAIAKLEFDRAPVATYQATAEQPRAPRAEGEGRMPGEDYNERGVGDALALLQRHGWQILRQRGEVYHLRKPNSQSKTPHATFGHRGAFLYVFSSSAYPFEPERGYSPFAIYALLECGGDHSEAAKRLAQDGYGDPLSERPNPSIEHAKRLSAILENDEESDPEEEGDNQLQLIIQISKTPLFAKKSDSQKPISLAVWQARGRRLKREKRDFDIAWAWAVGEWYNQSVKELEHREKGEKGREIFGNQLLTVRTYASMVSSWNRDDMKPEKGMTKNIIEVLAKAPKEVKAKYCHEWESGTKWTADALKERMENEDEITFSKREKEEDFAGKALEMLQEVLGHEALTAFGIEISKKGRTKEILADVVTKLAARIKGYGEQSEEAETPETVATAPPDPQEQPSNTEVAIIVDSIGDIKEPAPIETSEPVAALPPPMESATEPEQESAPADVSPPDPLNEASPAPPMSVAEQWEADLEQGINPFLRGLISAADIPMSDAPATVKEHAPPSRFSPAQIPDDDSPPLGSPPPKASYTYSNGVYTL